MRHAIITDHIMNESNNNEKKKKRFTNTINEWATVVGGMLGNRSI